MLAWLFRGKTPLTQVAGDDLGAVLGEDEGVDEGEVHGGVEVEAEMQMQMQMQMQLRVECGVLLRLLAGNMSCRVLCGSHGPVVNIICRHMQL